MGIATFQCHLHLVRNLAKHASEIKAAGINCTCNVKATKSGLGERKLHRQFNDVTMIIVTLNLRRILKHVQYHDPIVKNGHKKVEMMSVIRAEVSGHGNFGFKRVTYL